MQAHGICSCQTTRCCHRQPDDILVCRSRLRFDSLDSLAGGLEVIAADANVVLVRVKDFHHEPSWGFRVSTRFTRRPRLAQHSHSIMSCPFVVTADMQALHGFACQHGWSCKVFTLSLKRPCSKLNPDPGNTLVLQAVIVNILLVNSQARDLGVECHVCEVQHAAKQKSMPTVSL